VTIALAATAATLATRCAGVIANVTLCTCLPKLDDKGTFPTALSISFVVSTLTALHGATIGRSAVVKPPSTIVTVPAGISSAPTVIVPTPLENASDVNVVVVHAGLHVTLVNVMAAVELK